MSGSSSASSSFVTLSLDRFGLQRLLAALFLTCFLGVAHAALLSNGDFSSGKLGWWGGQFNAIPDAQTGAALAVTSGFAAQDKVLVEGGKRYRISLQMRSTGSSSSVAFVQASFRGTNVDPGWRGPQTIQQTWGAEPAVAVDTSTGATWRSVSVVMDAPAGANQMILYLRKKEGQPGTALFAKVDLEPTTESVTTAATLEGAQLRDHLLPAPVDPAKRAAVIARLVASGGAPAARLTLASDHKTRYHVYVGANADAMTLQAASDLSTYLKRITGASYTPLSDDNAPQDGPVLVVGTDNLIARKLCPSLSLASLGASGFVFCTSGENIVIAGATPRGTMYGVNWFLDRVIGVKWLAPDATYVPSDPTLVINAVNERQVPRFAYREILSAEGEDKAYRAHNLLDGESHGTSFSPTPAALDDWDHSWLAKGGDATLWDLLPRDKYLKDHPDWYAGGQVAMMNPDVRRIMAGEIVARLKALPDYKQVWFGIHDMDWGWDMDEVSQKFANQHGGVASAPYLDLIEDVAKQVRAVMPGARFAFNAYHWGFTPPTGMTMPDYILVYPMTIQVDYSTPLNAGRNEQLGKSLAGWNAMAKHMFVWDHVTNFAGFLQPTPNIYPIASSIQWLATLPNVSGYFAEGSWMTPGAEFATLRAWMIARLLWQPNQDARALVAEYCHAYFGAASPQMIAYIDAMHAALAASGDVLSEKTPVGMAMFTPAFVSRSDALFDEAEHSVANDPQLLARVRQARMPLDYVILARRSEYKATATGLAPGWQLDETKRLARLQQAMKAAHVTVYRQDGDLNALNELLSIDRKPASAPTQAASLAAKDWRDIQDLDFELYSSAKIVADSHASDGAAVKMQGDASDWAMQLKFDKLPREGKWDLYANVRAEGAASAGSIRVGSYPPMNRFNEVSASTVADGNYHSVAIPGGPFSYNADHEQGVYVQAAGMPAGSSVMIDRVIAIRHP